MQIATPFRTGEHVNTLDPNASFHGAKKSLKSGASLMLSVSLIVFKIAALQFCDPFFCTLAVISSSDLIQLLALFLNAR
jgi:hypothetical protein